MALISCPECQASVSDTAMKCTHCGVQLRKPTRSVFGKLIKWTFIGFNALMALWLWAGMKAASTAIDATTSSAEQAGAAIGTGIGAALVITLWVAGAVILGLFVMFTRPKS
jgi:hypothetical protein